jgi:hypothetical protein
MYYYKLELSSKSCIRRLFFYQHILYNSLQYLNQTRSQEFKAKNASLKMICFPLSLTSKLDTVENVRD